MLVIAMMLFASSGSLYQIASLHITAKDSTYLNSYKDLYTGSKDILLLTSIDQFGTGNDSLYLTVDGWLTDTTKAHEKLSIIAKKNITPSDAVFFDTFAKPFYPACRIYRFLINVDSLFSDSLHVKLFILEVE